MSFIITDEQKKELRKYMLNLEDFLDGDIDDFLIELNYAIVGELGDDYETTETSAKLQKIYDDILNQNE